MSGRIALATDPGSGCDTELIRDPRLKSWDRDNLGLAQKFQTKSLAEPDFLIVLELHEAALPPPFVRDAGKVCGDVSVFGDDENARHSPGNGSMKPAVLSNRTGRVANPPACYDATECFGTTRLGFDVEPLALRTFGPSGVIVSPSE